MLKSNEDDEIDNESSDENHDSLSDNEIDGKIILIHQKQISFLSPQHMSAV
jgi:hypothetical protein